MSGVGRMAGAHPLWQLTVLRLRSVLRVPETAFWFFGFPVVISIVLALAYHRQEEPRVPVAIVDQEGAAEVLQKLRRAGLFDATIAPGDAARQRLRQGDVSLVVVPGAVPELIRVADRPGAERARLMVRTALGEPSAQPALQVQAIPASRGATRYIDFLIPGLLGMGLMTTSLVMVTQALTELRTARMLKLLSATPMRRSDFLLSFVFARAVTASLEVAALLIAAWLFFDVRVYGDFASLIVWCVVGTLTFTCIALLVGARAQNSAEINGRVNAIVFPLVFCSGVFFDNSRFPEWMQPLIRLLPLNALVDGLRSVQAEGASLWNLGPQAAVMLVWAAVCGWVALRWFRWS